MLSVFSFKEMEGLPVCRSQFVTELHFDLCRSMDRSEVADKQRGLGRVFGAIVVPGARSDLEAIVRTTLSTSDTFELALHDFFHTKNVLVLGS